jgi:hypothetical protein
LHWICCHCPCPIARESDSHRHRNSNRYSDYHIHCHTDAHSSNPDGNRQQYANYDAHGDQHTHGDDYVHAISTRYIDCFDDGNRLSNAFTDPLVDAKYHVYAFLYSGDPIDNAVGHTFPISYFIPLA